MSNDTWKGNENANWGCELNREFLSIDGRTENSKLRFTIAPDTDAHSRAFRGFGDIVKDAGSRFISGRSQLKIWREKAVTHLS